MRHRPEWPHGHSWKEAPVSSEGGTENMNAVPGCTGSPAEWRRGALSSANRLMGAGGDRCWLNEKEQNQ